MPPIGEGDDIRSMLTDQFREAGVTDLDPAGAPGAGEAPQDQGEGRSAGEDADQASRTYVRDEAGRFAPKEEGLAAGDGKAPAKDSTRDTTAGAPKGSDAERRSPPDDQLTKPPVAAPRQLTDAPVGWAADARTAWSNLTGLMPQLPPAAQAALTAIHAAAHKRDEDAAAGSRQWQEEKRRYDATLAPLIQETARIGIAPDQGMQILLNAHHALEANPIAAIRTLCQQYGVDPATLAGSRSGSSSDDPAHGARLDLAAVREYIDSRLAPVQTRMQADEDARARQTVSMIESFSSDAERKEMWDLVTEDILMLIPSLKAAHPHASPEQILGAAYERAAWSNPVTRQRLIEKQTRDAEAARTTADRERAQRARLAASSLTGAPNGGAVHMRTEAGTIREELERGFGLTS